MCFEFITPFWTLSKEFHIFLVVFKKIAKLALLQYAVACAKSKYFKSSHRDFHTGKNVYIWLLIINILLLLVFLLSPFFFIRFNIFFFCFNFFWLFLLNFFLWYFGFFLVEKRHKCFLYKHFLSMIDPSIAKVLVQIKS